MKKTILVFASLFMMAFMFTSCQDEVASLSTDDEALIAEISTAAKSAVNANSLPSTVTNVVQTTYFETYVEEALLAKGKGFQLNMEDGQKAYFNTAGRELLARHRGGHEHPDRIHPDSLPSKILEYIAANYASDTIRHAKLHDNQYFVALESHTILIFDADGNFVKATTAEEQSCGGGGHGHGKSIAIEDLPAVITDYITANYAGSTIKKARYEEGEKYVVGIQTSDGKKKIVVFDENGVFLFEREKKH